MEGWIVDYFVIAMVAGYNRSFKTHSFDILGVLRVLVFVIHDTTRRMGGGATFQGHVTNDATKIMTSCQECSRQR